MSALNKSIATVCTFGVHFVGNISQEAADGGGEGGGGTPSQWSLGRFVKSQGAY